MQKYIDISLKNFDLGLYLRISIQLISISITIQGLNFFFHLLAENSNLKAEVTNRFPNHLPGRSKICPSTVLNILRPFMYASSFTSLYAVREIFPLQKFETLKKNLRKLQKKYIPNKHFIQLFDSWSTQRSQARIKIFLFFSDDGEKKKPIFFIKTFCNFIIHNLITTR